MELLLIKLIFRNIFQMIKLAKRPYLLYKFMILIEIFIRKIYFILFVNISKIQVFSDFKCVIYNVI